MTELTALHKHSCPACGAQAQWNPARQGLICPFCGTESPYEVDRESGEIREIDLVQTLRQLPEERRGWKAEKRTIRCRSCRAISVFDPERVGQNCEFCGSPELVDYQEIKAPIRPLSLLPFKIDEADVREAIRAWYGSRWFAPNALRSRALTDVVKGVYIPYWTFDSWVHCTWMADAGYYYSQTEVFGRSGGRRQSRQVQKVNWRFAEGTLDHLFDDEPVPATRGIHPNLLSQVEPFPTGDLVPYDTAFLSGFIVEHYQVVLIEAARLARRSMREQLKEMCAKQVPGDTYRNLRIVPDYSTETFKHILVPVWLLSYDYGHRSFQVVVNGYTGRIAGEFPRSLWKMVLAGLAIALLAMLLLLLHHYRVR